jgi:hypothetical protein
MSAFWAGKFQICTLLGLLAMQDYDAVCYEELELWDDGTLTDDDVDPCQPCDSPLGTTACVSGQRRSFSPRRPPDPRRQFNTTWQVVVSMQTLLGAPTRVQVRLGCWDRETVEIGSYDRDYLPFRCRHCRFFQESHVELTRHLREHRCLFTSALQARAAAPRAAEGDQPSTPQAAPDQKKINTRTRRRRGGRKEKTKTRDATTTSSSDLQGTATAHGDFKKQPSLPPADTPSTGPMDCAPEDTAPQLEDTADTVSDYLSDHLSDQLPT